MTPPTAPFRLSFQNKLARPGKSSHSFTRDGTETFEIMADDVGCLTSVTVRVEAGGDANDAWGLEKVEIACDYSW